MAMQNDCTSNLVVDYRLASVGADEITDDGLVCSINSACILTIGMDTTDT